MWPYYPEFLAKPVPRYTSYPTAAEFGPLDSACQREALERAVGDVSLYVHIPFCEKICFYCGCNTGAAGRKQRLESYLAALHEEIESVSGLLPRSARIRRISFGGGSPNAISPIDFVRLVDTLTVAFRTSDPVWSIELDPRTLTEQWGEVLGSVGITRASLGVQTFSDACQRVIGRVQSEDTIVRSVALLRKAGVTSLNFDMMYGLPGQTEAILLDSLERTRALGADRVALFGYAHVPHLVPRQKVIPADDLPDQRERFAMASGGYDYFVGHGYIPVGFDHFAKADADPLAMAVKQGRLRRNFQGFTDDDAPVLIGLGASAINSFPELFIQNEKNAGRYRMLASHGRLTGTRGIVRSAEDRRRGAAIESLLCDGRAQLDGVMLNEIAAGIRQFVDHGLAEIDGDWLRITPDGLPYARTIAALIDPYRQANGRSFSSAI